MSWNGNIDVTQVVDACAWAQYLLIGTFQKDFEKCQQLYRLQVEKGTKRFTQKAEGVVAKFITNYKSQFKSACVTEQAHRVNRNLKSYLGKY